MNILFDFVTLQDKFINGGAKYTLVILNRLLQNKNNKLYALIDENKDVPEFLLEKIKNNSMNVVFIDNELDKKISENQIEKFFIGIAQRYNTYDLSNLNCKIYIVCHDIGDICQVYDNNLYSKKRNDFVEKYCYVNHSFIDKFKKNIFRYCKKNGIFKGYLNFSKLIRQKNVFLITDSEYSKYALLYFFDDIANDIQVFYCPLEYIDCKKNVVEDKELKELICSNKKYFLLLSVNRQNKNAALFVEQWKKFCKYTNNKYYALLVGNCDFVGDNIITIKSLSENDLIHAYKHSFALVYPSITEGFGYPPLEAMSMNVPVVCAYATSIPEIIKDGGVLFNPYYPEALFKSLLEVIKNRDFYVENAKKQYQVVSRRQKEDLEKLISFIS